MEVSTLLASSTEHHHPTQSDPEVSTVGKELRVSTPVEAQPGANSPLVKEQTSQKPYTCNTTGRSVYHQQDVKIPHHTIRVFDQSGNLTQIIHTGFLQDDDDSDNEGKN